MKKLIVLSITFCIFSANCLASNPFDNFAANISQSNLDNLAKDLGSVLGGGSFRSGKNLGFPGFDISVRVPYITVNNNDYIVKSAGISNIPFPLLQVEIGLPLGIDLIGRGASYYSSNMTGFGLRYSVIKSWIPGVPDVSVQSVYNMLSVSSGANKLTANTLSTAAVASWKIVMIEPYVGVSYDSTNLTPDSSISSLTSSVGTVRLDGGINWTVFPYTYIQLGVSSANSNLSYTAGLGVCF